MINHYTLHELETRYLLFRTSLSPEAALERLRETVRAENQLRSYGASLVTMTLEGLKPEGRKAEIYPEVRNRFVHSQLPGGERDPLNPFMLVIVHPETIVRPDSSGSALLVSLSEKPSGQFLYMSVLGIILFLAVKAMIPFTSSTASDSSALVGLFVPIVAAVAVIGVLTFVLHRRRRRLERVLLDRLATIFHGCDYEQIER